MESLTSATAAIALDVAELGVRGINSFLHQPPADPDRRRVRIVHPAGQHNLAVGLRDRWEIDIEGHAGYYIGGMNQQASITVHGNVGWGVGENIMSGTVRVKGNASQCAAASGHGGLVVIEGDASSRCGISMKGVDIVVGGSVGHVSAFMAQAGRLVVCGNAGPGLGDSLYEAVIYVRGTIAGLGADARQEPLTNDDLAQLENLLYRAGFEHHPREFKRVASARMLYHFHSDHHSSY